MRHVLDRPVWSALETRHQALAQGGALARRYPSSIVPFAATGFDDAQSLQALQALVAVGKSIIMLQADAIALPAGLAAISTASGVQMVLEAPLPPLCRMNACSA
jgi:hypothetical protein